MRRIALIALKFLVSALLLYFAIGRIDFTAIGARFDRLAYGWLLVGFAACMVQTVLAAIRWQRIASICNAALPIGRAIRFNFVATFFNQVLPSTLGGDAARIIMLARSGAGWKTSTYSVLLDRFVGVLALAAVVTLGLEWSFQLVTSTTGRAVLALVGLGSLAAGAAFLALVWLPFLSRWRPTRQLVDISRLASRILLNARSGPPVLALSLCIHVLSVAIAWSAARSVGADLSFGNAILLVLPVLLIATAPVSIAGWGVRETALVLAFSYAGLPESDGLIVSVLFGVIQFAAGLVGGVAYFLRPANGS